MSQKSPILLTTMPKAGTYFLAEVLSEIGATNRHFHVAKHHAEDLLKCGDDVNKITPSKAKIPLELTQALYSVHGGEFVFGHIAKPLLDDHALSRYKVVYAYRDERDALQAEFYWFREVRKDMEHKFARYNHLPIQEHFIKYMQEYGPSRIRLYTHLNMWRNEKDVLTLDFDKFRADREYAQKTVIALGSHIGFPVSSSRAEEVLDASFNKDTKTKTNRDRSKKFWDDEAEKIYQGLKKNQKVLDVVFPAYWFIKKKFKKLANKS